MTLHLAIKEKLNADLYLIGIHKTSCDNLKFINIWLGINAIKSNDKYNDDVPLAKLKS
jgi:hypothetical protein